MNQGNTRKYNHYLYDLILHLKTNAKKFSESLGHKRTDRVYNVLKEINNLSPDLANEIVKVYPEVNYTWLISGQGKMINDSISLQIKNTCEGIKNKPHDEQMEMLYIEIIELRKELEKEKNQNKDQAEAIIEFIEKERKAVSDLILDLKNTLVEKKENK